MASTFFDEPSLARPVALQVENKLFWVSNQTLAAYSPVFSALFFGAFREADTKIVPLPDKKAEDVLELLLCLIPTPTVKKITLENADILLMFSDEYQIEDLKERCDCFLMDVVRSITGKNEQLLHILRLAHRHNLMDLFNECAKKCSVFSLHELLPILPEFNATAVACLSLYLLHGASSNFHVGNRQIDARCSCCMLNRKLECASCGESFCSECQHIVLRPCSHKLVTDVIENLLKNSWI